VDSREYTVIENTLSRSLAAAGTVECEMTVYTFVQAHYAHDPTTGVLEQSLWTLAGLISNRPCNIPAPASIRPWRSR
jgi:hypothetical protein